MAADLEALTARLLEAAKAAGAEAADAIAVAGDSLSIEVRNGALEQAERAEGDRPRPPRADRPAAGLRLVERHPRRDDRGDGRAGGGDGARGAGGPAGAGSPTRTSSRAGWDAAALDLVDPDAAADAPTRCRRRRSRPRRRRWRCRASARWTRPARAGRRAGCTSRRRNGFSGGYARTGHAIQAVAISRRRHRDGARLRLREPRAPRRPAGSRRDRPARRRARPWRGRGAGKPPTGACPGPLRRAGRLRADRASGAGDQRHRHRPRRELAQGRAGRAGAARRHRPRRGPAAAARSAARGPSTARACRWRAGRSSRTAC